MDASIESVQNRGIFRIVVKCKSQKAAQYLAGVLTSKVTVLTAKAEKRLCDVSLFAFTPAGAEEIVKGYIQETPDAA